MDPEEKYMMIIFDRFKNENIGDKLERIAMDGVGKFPIFILPTIKNCFQKNIIPANSIDSIASWYVFMKKIDIWNSQAVLEPVDLSVLPEYISKNKEKFVNWLDFK